MAVTRGHPALDQNLSSGTEFHALVETMRAHHHTMYDQWLSLAHELERDLRKADGGNPLLLGLDKRIAAARVVRPLRRAAGQNLEIARSIVASYNLFRQLFMGQQSAGRRARAFNVNG